MAWSIQSSWTTIILILSLLPLAMANSASIDAATSAPLPPWSGLVVWSWRHLLTMSHAISLETTFHRPSVATIRKSSDSFLLYILTSGSGITLGFRWWLPVKNNLINLSFRRKFLLNLLRSVFYVPIEPSYDPSPKQASNIRSFTKHVYVFAPFSFKTCDIIELPSNFSVHVTINLSSLRIYYLSSKWQLSFKWFDILHVLHNKWSTCAQLCSRKT